MKRIFLGVIFLLAAGVMCWADELVLSTYYPAPNGVYVNLRTSRLAIGDTGQATADGVIHLMPRNGDPSSDWGTGVAGEIAYSSGEQSLMVSNGSGWASAAGETRMITISKPYSIVAVGGVWIQRYWDLDGTFHNVGPLVYPSCPNGWTLVSKSMPTTSSHADTSYFIQGNMEVICEK